MNAVFERLGDHDVNDRIPGTDGDVKLEELYSIYLLKVLRSLLMSRTALLAMLTLIIAVTEISSQGLPLQVPAFDVATVKKSGQRPSLATSGSKDAAFSRRTLRLPT